MLQTPPSVIIVPFLLAINLLCFFSQETKVESNSKPEGWEKPDVRVISCGLDSEMTDAVEIDEKLPNLSGIFF